MVSGESTKIGYGYTGIYKNHILPYKCDASEKMFKFEMQNEF